MIRVAVIDDHSLVRTGLRSLISSAGDMQLAAEYCDGKTFLRDARHDMWCDVAILDVNLGDGNGLDVLTRVRTWRSAPRILMLSMHLEQTHAAEAMARGAHGYLSKDAEDAVLLQAIRTVAQDGIYLSPGAHTLMHQETGSQAGRHTPLETLSDQERRVLTLLQQGLTVKEIGRELDLARNTVSTYKARLMRKLGAKTLVDLLAYGHPQQTVEGVHHAS